MKTAGADLRAWDKFLATAHKLDQAHVRIGVLSAKGGDAQHQTDGEGEREPITMVELMAIHEFGAEVKMTLADGSIVVIKIPERAPIRRTFAQKQTELAEICAKLAKAVVLGKLTPARALALLGQWGVAAVRKTVTEGDGVPPPNAESTKKAKGSSRPLVDTGRLMQSVSYDVVEGEQPPPGAEGSGL